VSRAEPTTQYEALRALGAPKLPEGYAYATDRTDYYGSRVVALVRLPDASARRPREHVENSFVVDGIWRILCLGEQRAIILGCHVMRALLAHDLRAQARHERRQARLKVDGPLR